MLLILSNKWDISVDFVVRECRNRNLPYIRLNTEDLISNGASITIDDETNIFLDKDGVIYHLNDCITSVWCRRPGKVYEFVDGEKPSEAVQKFVHEQWIIWLEALSLLDNVLWVNDPMTSAKMENKIVQLNYARSLGFEIPKTIVTNSTNKIKEYFGSKDKKIIAKALYSPLIEEPDQDYFIFTNAIKIDQLVYEEVSICPSIFQERLSPKRDFRVTVVAEQVMSVEIKIEDSNHSNIDWRTLENDVQYKAIKLPKGLERKCADYVKQCGLIFGAIDIVEYNDTYYFIEINPSGEWGWLQKQLGTPVAEEICSLFLKKYQVSKCA